MDLMEMYKQHVGTNADLTLAVTPVDRARASHLGILRVDTRKRVIDFHEKPGAEADIDELAMPNRLGSFLGSMGMYIFKTQVLKRVLDNEHADFGNEIIPRTIRSCNVSAYVFEDFWVDIGTIRSFYDIHLDLASPQPSFNFYDERMPIYTHRRHLPATKVSNCTMCNTIAAEGSVIREASIMNSVVGGRTSIESGAILDGVVAMGADAYETPDELTANRELGIPNVGIGADTVIRTAIIDTNARIGTRCRIGDSGEDRADYAGDLYHIRDGIIIIPKNAVIPDDTVI